MCDQKRWIVIFLISLFSPYIIHAQSQLKLERITDFPEGNIPGNFKYINDSIFLFSLTNDNGGVQVLKMNTSNGIVSTLLSDGKAELSISWYHSLINGELYFTGDDGVHENELWVTDGTSAGTNLVKDINTVISNDIQKPSDGSSSIQFSTMLGNEMYFYANDYHHGMELWKTDGTEQGTMLIRDNFPGGFDMKHFIDNRRETVTYNNLVYFTESDGVNGWELWRTDGTEQGTFMLKDINPNGDGFPYNFFEFNGKLFFSAEDSRGNELWVTDGTEIGTKLFADINKGTGFSSSAPQYFVEFGGDLYFSASPDNPSDYAVYKVNLQSDTVEMIFDFPSNDATNPMLSGVFNDNFYFSGFSDQTGEELWRTDGSSSGTKLIKDINPHFSDSLFWLPASGRPMNFFQFENRLFFRANSDPTSGSQLFMMDDTEESIIVITPYEGEIKPDATKIFGGAIIMGNYCYLSINFDDSGQQIWKMFDPANVVGVEEGQDQTDGIKLYPNPVGETATLEITLDQVNEVSMTVYDLSGRVVHTKTQNGMIGLNKINILTENFTNGIYLLEVSSGMQSYTIRMIR